MSKDAQDACAVCGQRSLCSCQSLTAASPVGAEVWPLAKSESVVLGTSIASAICANVIPIGSARRSAMRDCQVTGLVIRPSIRDSVCEVQRQSVTEFRHLGGMKQTDHDWPAEGSHLGERLIYWRGIRKMSRPQLSKRCHVPVTTLSDIEHQRQNSSTKIPQIAMALQVNPHYLATGEGDPLRMVQQVPPRRDWPEQFPPLDLIRGLDENELILAGKELSESVQKIVSRRRKPQRKQT